MWNWFQDSAMVPAQSSHQETKTPVAATTNRFPVEATARCCCPKGRAWLLQTPRFPIEIPRVGPAADASPDPLPHVATQVQNQITNRVIVIARPSPNLLVSQLAQAVLNPRRKLLQRVARVVNEEFVERVHAPLWTSLQAQNRERSDRDGSLGSADNQ